MLRLASSTNAVSFGFTDPNRKSPTLDGEMEGREDFRDGHDIVCNLIIFAYNLDNHQRLS